MSSLKWYLTWGAPTGVIRLKTRDGEEYQWNKVTSTVGNLIIGKLYIDHSGVMRIRNLNTGLTACLTFKEQGLLDRTAHQVSFCTEREDANTFTEVQHVLYRSLVMSRKTDKNCHRRCFRGSGTTDSGPQFRAAIAANFGVRIRQLLIRQGKCLSKNEQYRAVAKAYTRDLSQVSLDEVGNTA